MEEAVVDRALGAGLRWTCVTIYTVLAATLCHNGTSVADFAALLVVAGALMPFVLLSDWIGRGRSAGGGGRDSHVD